MKKIIEKIYGAAQSVGAVAIFASGLILTLNVVLRLTIGKPLQGTYELVGYTAVIFASTAYPLATLYGGHVTIDTITSRLPRIPKITCEFIALIIDLFVSGVFLWSGWETAIRLMSSGESTDTLNWPLFPARFLWVIGCILMVVAGIYNITGIKQRYPKKGAENEAENQEQRKEESS